MYEIQILYINIAESEIKLKICTTATSGDGFLPSEIDACGGDIILLLFPILHKLDITIEDDCTNNSESRVLMYYQVDRDIYV